MRSGEVTKRIKQLGGTLVRQKGSHMRFQAIGPDGDAYFTTVPHHPGRDIPKGTLAAIARDLEPAFGKGWLQ